jgi:hypothetical protein
LEKLQAAVAAVVEMELLVQSQQRVVDQEVLVQQSHHWQELQTQAAVAAAMVKMVNSMVVMVVQELS